MENPNPSAARKLDKNKPGDGVLHKMRDYFSDNTKKG